MRGMHHPSGCAISWCMLASCGLHTTPPSPSAQLSLRTAWSGSSVGYLHHVDRQEVRCGGADTRAVCTLYMWLTSSSHPEHSPVLSSMCAPHPAAATRAARHPRLGSIPAGGRLADEPGKVKLPDGRVVSFAESNSLGGRAGGRLRGEMWRCRHTRCMCISWGGSPAPHTLSTHLFSIPCVPLTLQLWHFMPRRTTMASPSTHKKEVRCGGADTRLKLGCMCICWGWLRVCPMYDQHEGVMANPDPALTSPPTHGRHVVMWAACSAHQ
jgi:hypothetical protein